jgi:hypothetical protein
MEMNRRAFLKAAGAGLCLAGLEGPTALGDVAPKKPNIVLVMADDQGLGRHGYNGHPTLKTPHFDEMAARALGSTASTQPRRSARR